MCNIFKMGFFDFLKKDKDNSNNSKSLPTINNSVIDNKAISSLSTAYNKLENNLGLKMTGRCGLTVKSVQVQEFNEMKQYIDSFLSIVSDKEKTAWNFTYKSLVDKYGYLWFLLKGREMQDMVVAISSIGDTIHEKGFSRQLLAAIFEFTTGYNVNYSSRSLNKDNDSSSFASNNNQSQFLIYNYKTDKFYPFVPSSPSVFSELTTTLPNNHPDKKRNHYLELKIMTYIKDEIPFETDMAFWYPIWYIPFD